MTGEICWLRKFCALVFESRETRFDVIVLHGNVKKLRADLIHFIVLISFLRRDFTIFRDFSATLTLADARKTRKEKESHSPLFSHCHGEQPCHICFAPSSRKPWRKNDFGANKIFP